MATTPTTPATTGRSARTGKKREGPSPVHVLLSNAIEALESVTEVSQLPEIITALKFADSATGVDQAPVWRTISNMLTTAAEKNAKKAANA